VGNIPQIFLNKFGRTFGGDIIFWELWERVVELGAHFKGKVFNLRELVFGVSLQGFWAAI